MLVYPRDWALSPGVLRALRAWKERYHPNAKPTDKVFVEADGSPLDENDHLAAKLREHLRAAGIDRPELFTNTEHRRHVCALDARATFITISLTNGKSETWISDRTGHRSSAMIQRYNRKKRMLKQLLRGKRRKLVPLDEAIPELSANPNEPPVDVPDEPDPKPETDEDDPPTTRRTRTAGTTRTMRTRTKPTTQAMTAEGRQVRWPWCNHGANCTTAAPRLSRRSAAFPHHLAE